MNVVRRRGFVALALLAGAAFGADTPLENTRTTLEKWVETRQLISRTRSDWQTDKETLEQTAALFERELKSVEDQMAKLSTNNVQVEKERAEADGLLKLSKEGLDQSREFATGLEPQLIKLVPRLPVPLQDILKASLSRLPADPASTKMTAAERTREIVGILNELDKFNGAVNVFSEKRKNPKGEEVAVETVYVGLGAAYFVNESGDFAGMGAPGPNGWEWINKPELATPVREVVRIYRNEHPARFLTLPVVIR